MFDDSGLRGELVLVDDGSADKTAEVIRAHSEKDRRIVGVFHRVNRGMAGAWRTGVNATRGAHVAIIDADLQYQPEDILRLYRALMDSSVDIVQGWRSSVGRERGYRYSLSRGGLRGSQARAILLGRARLFGRRALLGRDGSTPRAFEPI